MLYLVITPFFPTPSHYACPFIYDQVKAIERSKKYDQVIVLRPTGYGTKETSYEYGGVTVHLFKTLQLPSNTLPGFFDWVNIRSFLRCVDRLGIDLNDVAVAHAHVYPCYAYTLKKKNPNIKAVIQFHGADPFTIRLGKLNKYVWHRKIVAKHNMKWCNKMDLHLAISHKVLANLKSFPYPSPYDIFDDYTDRLKGLEKIPPAVIKNEYVLYNGVDISIFFPNISKKEKDKFRIGCVGNFNSVKEQMTLIKAVNVLIGNGICDLEVIFVGSGPTLNSCMQYVNSKSLSSHIKFQKEVFHEKLPDFYRSLDLFVLPSVFEGFGCVYTEAYACGIPFIAVEKQGVSELIPEENHDNWLIKKGDYIGLSKLIKEYKSNPIIQILTKPLNINLLVGDYLSLIENLKLK